MEELGRRSERHRDRGTDVEKRDGAEVEDREIGKGIEWWRERDRGRCQGAEGPSDGDRDTPRWGETRKERRDTEKWER